MARPRQSLDAVSAERLSAGICDQMIEVALLAGDAQGARITRRLKRAVERGDLPTARRLVAEVQAHADSLGPTHKR